MRLGLVAGMAAALAVGGFSAARADDAATVKKTLQASYDTGCKAIHDRKLDSLFAFFSDDFTEKGLDGKTLDRAAVEGMFKQMLESMKTIGTCSARVNKVSLKGDTATADVTIRFSGDITGEDQKPHKMVGRSTERDTWKKTGSDWKLVHTDDLTQNTTLDGKAVKAPGPSK